ncbi:PREDICTED: uncharacterized protein LOC105970823 [Erythranthe guttata]|uniref:uncharacterized protein LOC105970823 n=1 Tax=Erythranthe guttata TaxID=4155 RepID=UPI00064E0313|nr:PREDICTED: uncharacterized protein LOC105970823 [Erythranthe guttata]|eukprot:XP_012851101.1 PREDICTED: uncharacterized protein LOC105970823 [Erythranthe guttata]
MSRPRTRNQRSLERINNAGWPYEYDECMIDAAATFASEVETLEDPEVYEECLFEVYITLCFQFARNFDDIATKCRMNRLRNRYFAFKDYIAQDVVTYDVRTGSLTVDRSMWPLDRKETEEERTFRINRFPLYEDCHFVFDVKQAPEVKFRGLVGYDPELPLVIGDEVDDDGVVAPQVVAPQPNPPQVVDPHYAIYLDDLYDRIRNEGRVNVANNNNANEEARNEGYEPAVSFSDEIEEANDSDGV